MKTKLFSTCCTILLLSCFCTEAQEPHIRNTIEEWKLIYSDEFDGNTINWDDWETENSDIIKRNTYRGRENVSVIDGELRLNVTKESRNGSIWSAASIYLKKPLERNTYIECRFKSAQCTGVNNAFWLACRTRSGTTFDNRYEIDIVEAKQNKATGKGSAHLAWHDWKTFGYALNAKGKKCDIAQGISVEHSFDEYHIWGLWYGENDIIYYLDGKPVWTGKTHKKYKEQWKTGVGKAPVWNTVEERRAYGNYGQDDWSYRGGYNGDIMNILLSTLPWHTSSSPLTDEADGTYMAVDYVRIFKPKNMSENIPEQYFDNIPEVIHLSSTADLSKDSNYYYAFSFKPSKNNIVFDFIDKNGKNICTSEIKSNGIIISKIGNSESSTETAFPVSSRKQNKFKRNHEYLAVIRITASSLEKDAISIKIFKAGAPDIYTEPYFYPNIDSKGNTSITNEWDINAKDISDAEIQDIIISERKNISWIRTGKHYSNILPQK